MGTGSHFAKWIGGNHQGTLQSPVGGGGGNGNRYQKKKDFGRKLEILQWKYWDGKNSLLGNPNGRDKQNEVDSTLRKKEIHLLRQLQRRSTIQPSHPGFKPYKLLAREAYEGELVETSAQRMRNPDWGEPKYSGILFPRPLPKGGEKGAGKPLSAGDRKGSPPKTNRNQSSELAKDACGPTES